MGDPIRAGAEDRPRRPFTTRDGLILLVPLAAALSAVQGYEPSLRFLLDNPGRDDTPDWFKWSGMALRLAARFAALGMPGLLAVALLPPRPRRARLARLPGVVACAAGTAALAWGGAHALALGLFRLQPIGRNDALLWPVVEARVAPAILAAWAALALSGRWRPAPHWIDRCGRACGWFWVILAFYRGAMAWSDLDTTWIAP